ncbi:MAG: formate dehydrogenase subunit alpha, partial [Desulfovibrio sp. S3730MH75]
MSNSIDELDLMRTGNAIFTIGSNTTECHPIIGMRMMEAARRGTKLIVADPRAITLTQHADVWLQLKPGTDVALLNSIANVLISEGLTDENFIATRTEGYETVRNLVTRYTPEFAETITTIPAQKIYEAARIIGSSKTTATYYTMGITQHTSGVDNVRSVANIAMLTGNMGKPLTGVNPLRGQNNVQGSCDMGALPNVLTGYQQVSSPEVREKFSKAWGVDISATEGLRLPDVFEGIENDTIKGLFVFGENPMRSDPDITHVKHCLDAVDFLVVQDIFMTETAELADVVLPGASFAEKDGTFASTERRVQLIRKAVDPIGNSKADRQILAELLSRMGISEEYASPEDIFEEIRSLTPSYSGISYSRLETEHLQWPCPSEDHQGTPILHVDKFACGKGAFLAAEYRDPAEVTDEDYPLILTTGRITTHYHTGTMSRRCWGLNGARTEEMVEVNPADADSYNIEDGDYIVVTSRRGALRARAQVTDRVPEGVIFTTFHFSESPGNILTNS